MLTHLPYVMKCASCSGGYQSKGKFFPILPLPIHWENTWSGEHRGIDDSVLNWRVCTYRAKDQASEIRPAVRSFNAGTKHTTL